MKTLSRTGVPVGGLVAPVIPALNEKDVEAIFEQADAGGDAEGGVGSGLGYGVGYVAVHSATGYFPARQVVLSRSMRDSDHQSASDTSQSLNELVMN